MHIDIRDSRLQNLLMETDSQPPAAQEYRELQRWNRMLFGITAIAILWSLFTLARAVWGNDFRIGLPTPDGIKLFDEKDFTRPQRLILTAIAGLPEICWIGCMWQIVRMSRSFSAGQVLSLGMVKCLEWFGRWLVVLAISEAAFYPLVVVYLRRLGKLGSSPIQWDIVIGSGALSSLMAAVLVIVIGRILRIGVRIREDSELTI
jgi:hypothetical protein